MPWLGLKYLTRKDCSGHWRLLQKCVDLAMLDFLLLTQNLLPKKMAFPHYFF